MTVHRRTEGNPIPIIYTDPTYAATTMATAELAAQRKSAEQAEERQARFNLASMEIRARRELVAFEAQMRIQAAKLSQAWDLEKMQRESELDFQFAQKKLSLARDAVLQKETLSKEKYTNYVSHIDEDKSLSTDERSRFKRMAYDKMVGDMNVAEWVYFGEKSQTSKGSYQDLIDEGNKRSEQTAGTESPETAASKQAWIEMPNASDEQRGMRAKEIVQNQRINTEMRRIMEAPGNTLNTDQAEKLAEKNVTVEQKVQEGLAVSRTLGYTPATYRQVATRAVGQVAELVAGRTPPAIRSSWDKFTERAIKKTHNFNPKANLARPPEAFRAHIPEAFRTHTVVDTLRGHELAEYMSLKAEEARKVVKGTSGFINKPGEEHLEELYRRTARKPYSRKYQGVD